MRPAGHNGVPRPTGTTRRQRLARWIIGSLLVHAALVALLFLSPPKRSPPEPAASNEVPVVFDTSGGGPALPQPEATQSTLGDPDPVPPLPNTPPLPDAPPAPPSPPSPQPLAQAPPAPPGVMPPPPVPPDAPIDPVPAPLPPRTLPAEPPPPLLAQPAPPLTPEPPPPSDTAELLLPPPPPPPPPQPVAPRVATPRPSSPFPGTLDLTRQPPLAFAQPPRPQARAPRPLGRMDLSMGNVPAQRSTRGERAGGNMSHVAGAEASGSWNGAFMAWVREHGFYPPQAAQNGEDGSVMVRVVIERSGRVRSVEMRRPSGSVWLNMGLQSMFRSQVVPPFTPDMQGETTTMDFTMHYIIVYN
jgi:protein TonB